MYYIKKIKQDINNKLFLSEIFKHVYTILKKFSGYYAFIKKGKYFLLLLFQTHNNWSHESNQHIHMKCDTYLNVREIYYVYVY